MAQEPKKQPDQQRVSAPAITPPAITVFDIDGVVRDVAGSYLRALADTVEEFTAGQYRPSLAAVDELKAEGRWNNDWEASQELVYRYFETLGKPRDRVTLDYAQLVAFFQQRYRGDDFSGYIQDEPLLMSASYLQRLSAAGIAWGFFSGATRGSASFVLNRRLGLMNPVLVAMEDAPGKPDPMGLLAAVAQLTPSPVAPTVLYVGDTVADMQTVVAARQVAAGRSWKGVGIIPPHVQDRRAYTEQLQQAGAALVLEGVEQLTPEQILSLVAKT